MSTFNESPAYPLALNPNPDDPHLHAWQQTIDALVARFTERQDDLKLPLEAPVPAITVDDLRRGLSNHPLYRDDADREPEGNEAYDEALQLLQQKAEQEFCITNCETRLASIPGELETLQKEIDAFQAMWRARRWWRKNDIANAEHNYDLNERRQKELPDEIEAAKQELAEINESLKNELPVIEYDAAALHGADVLVVEEVPRSGYQAYLTVETDRGSTPITFSLGLPIGRGGETTIQRVRFEFDQQEDIDQFIELLGSNLMFINEATGSKATLDDCVRYYSGTDKAQSCPLAIEKVKVNGQDTVRLSSLLWEKFGNSIVSNE